MTYAKRQDVEDIFGALNVKKWADLDNEAHDEDIAARIGIALSKADDEVNDRLRGGPYVIPFTTAPSTIVHLAALYTGVWLYSNRGVVDYDADDKAQDQLQHQRKEFDTKIRDILAGRRRLSVGAATGVKTYPESHTFS